MTKLKSSEPMFVMFSGLLSNDERGELTNLSSAAITYNERVRDIFMGAFDRRITDLRAEQALWSGDQDTVSASDHAAPDTGETLADSSSAGAASSKPNSIASEPPEAELACGNARIEHISSCNDQREATFVIGELNPEGISVSEAAALIHAAGLSRGKVDTVMSNIHNYMTNDTSWQKLAPSRFRLLPEIRAVDAGNLKQQHKETTEDDDLENDLVQVA